MTPEYMEASLTNHTPTEAQIEAIANVRHYAKKLTTRIFNNCPPSAERTIALRDLEVSVMYAVKSIVLEGKY